MRLAELLPGKQQAKILTEQNLKPFFRNLFRVEPEKNLTEEERARKKSGIYLKPKDSRDFFSQEMGKAFVPDRYIDIFQGRALKIALTKHYNPHGIKMLMEIYEKASLKILTNFSMEF